MNKTPQKIDVGNTSAIKCKKNKEKRSRKRKRNSEAEIKKSKPETKIVRFSRCARCFISHFPHKKFCRWTTLKESRCNKVEFFFDKNIIDIICKRLDFLEKTDVYNEKQEIIRLRGGALGEKSKQSLIVSQAVESARKHGIDIIQGKINYNKVISIFTSLHDFNKIIVI